MKNIGIIGGSGIYRLEGVKVVEEHRVETPFGPPSDCVFELELGGERVFFIPRHGRDHSFLPSEINYRANIFALKKMNVAYTLSLSAVGSFRDECPPGSFVLPDQFIDWTRGRRERSFFGDSLVGHISAANPVSGQLRELLASSCQETGVAFQDGGVYLCIEGPQFSTRAESHLYRSFNATVIGMTNVPECFLAKEAGMAYATVALVTDFDCWKESHCTVEEIMAVMKQNSGNALKVLQHIVPRLASNRFDFEKENAASVMTPRDRLSPEQVEILDVLLN